MPLGGKLSWGAKKRSAGRGPRDGSTTAPSADARRGVLTLGDEHCSIGVRGDALSSDGGMLQRHAAGPRWYAVATKLGQELVAARHLTRQGFEPFTPSLVKTVRHARRRIERRVALFPGYLFVRLDIEHCAWRSVNGTLGVRSLVMAGERPLAAPCGLVESFIELSDKSGLIEAKLETGQRVEVLSGPFATLVGTVERLDVKGRAHVLLRLLNGESAVAMDSSVLWPAA